MQCAACGDKWKREVVGVGRAEVSEPAASADGIQGYGVCDGVRA
jgi:hypothetical protein